MAFPDSGDPKTLLRAAMRRVLRGKLADSAAIHPALERWLASHPGVPIIAVFAALPGEVDLTEAVVRHPERSWVYPRVAGDDLHFHRVENPARQLTPGAFGVREPSPDLPYFAVDQIDAFLCPGLAFDPCGGRLGRGRGFYDRLLAKARPGALRIGICFPYQIVPDTFQEPHDIPMDLVIS